MTKNRRFPCSESDADAQCQLESIGKRDINESLLIGYQNGSHHQTTDWGEIYKAKNKTERFCLHFLQGVYLSQICFTMLQHIIVTRGH